MSYTKENLGAIFSPQDVRDYTVACAYNAQSFPEEFELDNLPRIKNQGNVGSCVAHSIAETIEYHNYKQKGHYAQMSTNYIYGNRDNSSWKESGMIVRDALKNALEYGDVEYQHFTGNTEVPYVLHEYESVKKELAPLAKPNRISSYVRCHNANDVKYALMNYGPVVFAMSWYDDISVDKSGSITTDCNPSQIVGGHCMVMYGWNKDGWKIQNSWGNGWGKGGRAILPYKIPVNEYWGVIDNIVDIDDDDIKKPFSSLFGQFIAKIFNSFLHLFSRKK